MLTQHGKQLPSERQDRLLPFIEIPIDPDQVAVVAVGICVTSLGSSQLIAMKQHGNARGKSQGGQEVLLHDLSLAADLEHGRWPLFSPIGAQHFLPSTERSVALVWLLLPLVADKVVQRETIVAS